MEHLQFAKFALTRAEEEDIDTVFGRFGLSGATTDITLPTMRDGVAWVANRAGAESFDPRKSLCVGQTCITQVNGVSIYKGDNHIAASQIAILEGNFKQVLFAHEERNPNRSLPTVADSVSSSVGTRTTHS